MAQIGKCPDCGSKKEVILIGGKCPYHWRLSGVAANPVQELKESMKYIGPRKVSEKMKAANKLYAKIRKGFMAEHPICAAKLPGCTVQSSDVHHMRGRIGKEHHNVANWLAVCRSCHQLIEANPAMAIEKGFSKKRHGG